VEKKEKRKVFGRKTRKKTFLGWSPSNRKHLGKKGLRAAETNNQKEGGRESIPRTKGPG